MSKEYKQAIHRRNTNGQYEKMLNLTTIKKKKTKQNILKQWDNISLSFNKD